MINMNTKTTENYTLEHYVEVESTNSIAAGKKEYNNLSCIVSDRQTGGRGRLGRSFYSPNGGLYMSVIVKPEFIKCGLHVCTCAAALAVKEALEENGIDGVSVKWVNDILKDGKKICGILTEARSIDGKVERVIIGIGINLTEPQGGFPKDIVNKAGSADFHGDKIALAVQIVSKIGKYVTLEKKDISSMFYKVMAGRSSLVNVTDYADNNRIIMGVIEGINEDCNLLLRLVDGSIRTISSGEIFY